MRARELAKSLDLPLIRVGVTSHDLATHWVIAAGGIVGVNPAIALVPAGAQRVATNAADVMVQTLMGVAA